MRRRIFLAFAALVVGILVILVGTVLALTRTDWGRRQVVQFVERRMAGAFPGGRFHMGALGGNLFTGLTLDTLELRDRNDSVFVALGRIELTYDPRDLWERRILIHRVRLGSLTANIFEDSVGMFNFRRLFESDRPPGPPQPAQPPSARRSWGHFIKLEDVVVDHAQVTMTTRWTPSDLLGPTERDSVIAFSLARTDKEIWWGPGVFYETRRWTDGGIELDSVRIDDQQPGGRWFAIRRLAIDENDPPFRFRDARGDIRIQGDSIWADVPHFELPGSRASAKGKVWWGAGQPTRFDLAITSDSLSLADIAWIYPTLPTTGSGRMDLVIRSEPDPRIIDYVLSNMDVRTTNSRLRGAMTFGVGAPVTVVKDVDLTLQPLDFRLIETLAGEPLPYPWRGTISGTVLASGGPLDNWMVDEADVVFRDANVQGAVTVGRARGRMNILEPGEVVFSGFDVDVDQLDLRTLQYLVPTFPRLNGQIAGRAVLDSLWTDVRFREADLRHTDGSGPETRMVGAGRVTFAETYTAYDVALDARPFSFTTFSRAYTDSHIPLKGEYEGPIRLFGTAQDLAVTTQLQGPAGMVGYDGRVDGDSLGGYGLDGVLRFAQLDLRTLLDTAITPRTDLWGSATLNVTFDSLLTLAGTATMELDRHSRIDEVTVYGGSRTRLRFADGVLQVLPGDTVRYGAGQVVAEGGLGLGAAFRDSLTVEVRVDTLGGLRPYLNVAPEDTLRGTVTARLMLAGSLDTLGVGGWLVGDTLRMPGMNVQRVRVTPVLFDVLGTPGGTVRVVADTASVGGVGFRSIQGDVDVRDGRTGSYSVLAVMPDSSTVASQGDMQFHGDTTLVRVEGLSASLADRRYTLQRPVAVRLEPERVAFDSVVLAGPDDARLTFLADAPDSAAVSARILVERLNLEDLSRALQTDLQFSGRMNADLTVAGTRDQPRMRGSAAFSDISTGTVNVAAVAFTGEYENHRLRGSARVSQADTTVLTVDANLPVDLALRSRDDRWLDDTMRVTVRSPDVDLRILETFTPAVRSASGILTANLDLSGPLSGAELNGAITVTNGRATIPGMGITLRNTRARILARNDTLRIDSLYTVSGPEDNDYLAVSGFIAHPLDTARVSFDLAARAAEFHAIGLAQRIADLDIDANVRWTGTDDASRATGRVVVQRGELALPETSDKDLFVIDNWQELGIDSTDVRRLGLVPAPASRFFRGLAAEDVRIEMGPDVWLRSEDAAIKLAGAVNVSVDSGLGLSRDQLVLVGDLQTERGTYRLNVSPFQRTFFVESGRLRFSGVAGFNPDLDIRAVYTSRQIEARYGSRYDVRVGAHITGSLVSPSVYLYSADSLTFLSEQDLWSYVLFNRPSFAVGGGRRDADFALSLLVGTVSSLASSLASRYAGGLVDWVQLSAAEGSLFGADQQSGFLAAPQLGIGKQYGDRLFVTATYGLCQISQASADRQLLSSLGAKVEYRFGRTSPAGVSMTYEPSLQDVICRGAADAAVTATRQQFGFDIFRVWRR